LHCHWRRRCPLAYRTEMAVTTRPPCPPPSPNESVTLSDSGIGVELRRSAGWKRETYVGEGGWNRGSSGRADPGHPFCLACSGRRPKSVSALARLYDRDDASPHRDDKRSSPLTGAVLRPVRSPH